MVAMTRRHFFKVTDAAVITGAGLSKTIVATDLALDDDGTRLFIDGSALPIDEFPEQFEVIGRKHGGTGTTFNLPDRMITQQAHVQGANIEESLRHCVGCRGAGCARGGNVARYCRARS